MQKERTRQYLLLVLKKIRKKKEEGDPLAGLTWITIGMGDSGTTSKQPIIFKQTLIAVFTNSHKFYIYLLNNKLYAVAKGSKNLIEKCLVKVLDK